MSGKNMIFAIVITCFDVAAFMLRLFHNPSWLREESSTLMFPGPCRTAQQITEPYL
jgi:hypothetical protein